MVVIVLASGATFGQIDSARNVGTNTELQEGPSRTKQSPSQNPQFRKEDRVEVPISDIPANLIAHLRKEKKYQGWENNPVYLDRNSKAYIIHVTNGGASKTYQLNEEGKLLSEDQ